MFKKSNVDIIIVLMSLLIGVFIGYMIGNSLSKEEKTTPTFSEITLDYVYILQIARFDNPSGASNYQSVLAEKNLYSIVVFDKVYYYVYGAISASEEGLSDVKNKYIILGYNPIVKKELLIERTNLIIDNDSLYAFYSECINNLYASLKNENYEISETYNLNPVNIELFTQLTILKTMKNSELRLKAQMQAYKLIIESM